MCVYVFVCLWVCEDYVCVRVLCVLRLNLFDFPINNMMYLSYVNLIVTCILSHSLKQINPPLFPWTKSNRELLSH
jgi:hypothetical protein